MRARRMDAEGKGYAWVAGKLRTSIAAGEVPAGVALPSTKQIGSEYGVSSETARRAAKQLEAEGLLVSEPRQGFRVMARANDPDRGLPIAFVVSATEQAGLWDEFYRTLFAGLQKAATDRGWSLLAVGAGTRSGREVMAQLRDCRVCGLVLDTMNAELLAAVTALGLPVVMMDSWQVDMRLDAVVQDSFQGALLATRHLIGQGHERIGWLGPIAESTQSQERFGGVAAGVAAAGLKSNPEFMRDSSLPEFNAVARKMLTHRDRPTAVLGLWYGAVKTLVQTALELGLKPGRDVEIVGWTPEENYAGSYRALFKPGCVPPTMVWSMAELTRMTIERLAERRLKPGLSPALIKIPARLKSSE